MVQKFAKTRYDVLFEDALKGVKSEWKQYCAGGNLDFLYIKSKCEQMIKQAQQIKEHNIRLMWT